MIDQLTRNRVKGEPVVGASHSVEPCRRMAGFLLAALAVCLWALMPVRAEKVGTLYDLTQEGSVEVTALGNGAGSVTVKVRRRVEEPVTVSVPLGTFFVSGNAGTSNMVAVGTTDVTLTDNGWRTLSVRAASTTWGRKVPRTDDTFSVRKSYGNAELERVLRELDAAPDVPITVYLAAVWIVTDDVDFGGLGDIVLTSNDPLLPDMRVIGAPDAARAMWYCARGGCDITSKAIWRDRARIAGDVPYEPLNGWLRDPHQGTLTITSNPPGATITVDGRPVVGITPCRVTLLWGGTAPHKAEVSVKLLAHLAASRTVIGVAGGEAVCDFALEKATAMHIVPGVKRGDVCANPRDGAVMLWIPPGEFLMGSTVGDREARANERPQRTVHLDGYWIYKTEVTVSQYRRFCEATGREMPEAPKWGWKDDHPIIRVSWEDATEYAAWAGVSLPTEAQWEKGARGTDGRPYPWGFRWDATKCVCDANCGDTTAPVGSKPAGASPYGCLDMAGNVSEWCADWYGPYGPAQTRNPAGPATGEIDPVLGGPMRVVRGGGYVQISPLRTTFRYGQRAQEAWYDGFRCVIVPPAPNTP